MKNFLKPGKHISYVNPNATTIKSGEVVVPATGHAYIAIADIKQYDEGELLTEGVVKLKKNAPLVMTQFDKLYWDNTAKEVNKTASGNTFIGLANTSQLSADTTVEVILTAKYAQ